MLRGQQGYWGFLGGVRGIGVIRDCRVSGCIGVLAGSVGGQGPAGI